MHHLTDKSLRNLNKQDLLRITGLYQSLYLADSHEALVNHCAAVLNQVFRKIHVAVAVCRLSPFGILEQQAQGVEELWLSAFAEHALKHTHVRRMFHGLQPVTKKSGLKKNAEPRVGFTDEFNDYALSRNQVWAGFRSGKELLTFIYMKEKGYSAREYSMMHMLQPHLEIVWNHWIKTRRLQDELKKLRAEAVGSAHEHVSDQVLMQGFSNLTPRQRDVSELVADGMDNREIAGALHISVRTVQKHLEAIFQKLNINNRTELAAAWYECGGSL